MKFVWFLTVSLFLTGCVAVRSYTIRTPRTDLDIQGNQGYLAGTPKGEPAKNRLGDTRQISVVEVEFIESKNKKKVAKKEKKTDAKAKEKFSSEEEFIEWEEQEELMDEFVEDINVFDGEIDSEEANEEDPEEGVLSGGGEKDYVVGKNDTLQKISDKFYGTTRKWKKIYDANSKIMKSPDKVYPGMKLKIPE